MGLIQILPLHVSNQIAAGEVIDRPASVIKELLENAFDAGATRLKIKVGQTTTDYLSVTDNGCGFLPEDAVLAFCRHSTSKLTSIGDLESLSTYGFRGEALHAISQMAEVVLTTRSNIYNNQKKPQTAGGLEVSFAFGRFLKSLPAAFGTGTECVVKNIFHNHPVRKKFLKSELTEFRHIQQLVMAYALAHPTVAFELEYKNRMVFNLPGCEKYQDRFYQLFGEKTLLQHLPITTLEKSEYHVSGFISKPGLQKTNRNHQFFFINGRWVKNATLQAAIQSAYLDLLPAHTYPSVFLFLQVPTELIDFNVHPRKQEVRFSNESNIFDFIKHAIQSTLFQSNSIQVLNEFKRDLIQKTDSQLKTTNQIDNGIQVLGQIQNTYIVAEDKTGILLIDQHVAHERILYNALRSLFTQGGFKSFLLEKPHYIALTEYQYSLFSETYIHSLTQLGFDIYKNHLRSEYFICFRAIPDGIDIETAQKLLFLWLDQATGNALLPEVFQHEIAAQMSCKSAIKANTPLDPEFQRKIVSHLTQTPPYSYCPHGRPVILRIPLCLIEKEFKRK